MENAGGVLTKVGETLPVTINMTPGSFSLQPERLVFADNRDMVVIVSPDGRQRTVRATGLFQMARPSLSPDGARAAVQASEDPAVPAGSLDIYIVDLATGSWRKISNLPVNEESPEWFPRSNKIAYSSFSPTEGIDLHVYDVDKQQEALLVKGAGGIHVAVSPDERTIFVPSVMRLYDATSGQVVADLRTAMLSALQQAGYAPDQRFPGQGNRGTYPLDATFSPDSKLIVFDGAVKKGDQYGVILARMAVDGSGFAVLQDMLDVNPTFSNNHNFSQTNPYWLGG